MYVTQRFDNIDGSPKREIYPNASNSFIFFNIFYSLRLAFILQLIGVLLCAFSKFLTWTANHQDQSYLYCQFKSTKLLTTFGSLLITFGSVYFIIFQAFLSDDASWNRGYQAGSKYLNYASVINTIGSIIHFVLVIYLNQNCSSNAISMFLHGGTEYLIMIFAQFLHSISWLFYGKGFFLLEQYHDKGSNPTLGIIVLFLYTVTGLLGFLNVGYNICPGICSIMSIISLIAGIVWAFPFEIQVNCISPLLHETELSNEVEAQVEAAAAQNINNTPPYISFNTSNY